MSSLHSAEQQSKTTLGKSDYLMYKSPDTDLKDIVIQKNTKSFPILGT
ncbi:hypothetical protein MARI151_20744 [Maribacter litoralis]|uniref:Uncharacterized protein n=2 Tax=Maribacter litoralis TaxID=2059726 RepID=A0A653R1U5_9FLAO|nr:hypothetical protein MARI151_20744 [Maribacter litoralis]